MITHYLMSLAIDDRGEEAAEWMVGYVKYLALVENRPLTHPIFGQEAQS